MAMGLQALGKILMLAGFFSWKIGKCPQLIPRPSEKLKEV